MPEAPRGHRHFSTLRLGCQRVAAEELSGNAAYLRALSRRRCARRESIHRLLQRTMKGRGAAATRRTGAWRNIRALRCCWHLTGAPRYIFNVCLSLFRSTRIRAPRVRGVSTAFAGANIKRHFGFVLLAASTCSRSKRVATLQLTQILLCAACLRSAFAKAHGCASLAPLYCASLIILKAFLAYLLRAPELSRVAAVLRWRVVSAPALRACCLVTQGGSDRRKSVAQRGTARSRRCCGHMARCCCKTACAARVKPFATVWACLCFICASRAQRCRNLFRACGVRRGFAALVRPAFQSAARAL